MNTPIDFVAYRNERFVRGLETCERELAALVQIDIPEMLASSDPEDVASANRAIDAFEPLLERLKIVQEMLAVEGERRGLSEPAK